MADKLTKTKLKDPSANLDFVLDLSEWMVAGDEFVEDTPPVSISPDGEMSCPSASYVGTTIVFWLSGGVAGTTYTVTVGFATKAGRTDERTVRVEVVNR